MRPLRFGIVWRGDSSPVGIARRAEDVGYSSLLFPDHTGMLAPLPAMAAAAAVTSRLRIGTQVVNIAFRPLGALAQEAAAVDVVSDGRLDLGLGAGYAEAEVRSLGLPFPSAAARIRDVERSLDVLPRLFAGETVTEEPGPGRLHEYSLSPLPPQGAAVPFMVGGNGDRLLSVAAARADIVQFTGFSPGIGLSHFTDRGLADRLAHVERVAGDRLAHVELSVLVQRAGVVPDPRRAAEDLAAASDGGLTVDDVLASPFVLLGSVDTICERILELRERFGISYFAVFDGMSDGFDEVVAKLAGR